MADLFTKKALPSIKYAQVGLSAADNSKSSSRIAKNTWLFDNSTELAFRVQQRLNWITGLQTSQKLDRSGEGRSGEYEHLQVANYGIGGQYYNHMDMQIEDKDPDTSPMVKTTDGDFKDPKAVYYSTGDRMTTLMLYLTKVPKGGNTVFPRSGPLLKSTLFC